MRGAAEAPPLIRAALRSPAGNSWTEDLRDLNGADGLADAGDVSLPEGCDARQLIEDGVGAVFAIGGRPIVLGGDHSITYPILRAVARFRASVTVLHFDAHPDLYDEFDGNRYSHACQFARVMEERIATRLVQVGIRTMNDHQRDQARRFGVEVIDMKAWSSGTRPAVHDAVYVSLDLDALDPAHAPGVSHREPGGLTVREVITVIQTLPGDLVAADIVEYNPRRDIEDMTATVAAKFVKEIASRMLAER